MFIRHLIAALLLFVWSVCAAAAEQLRIIDGDTLDLDGVRYRLHGIDAPEAGQLCRTASRGDWPCGDLSIKNLSSFLVGKSVECEPREKDLYGRWIAICRADGADVSKEMVASGFAWAFRKYSLDYVNVEDSARKSRKGIWQAPTETPWDFRAHRWDSATGEAEMPGCPIKGNINRKNEKIYHPPWSKDYSKTRIDTRKGERWFCLESEALAAGWRPPQWGH